MSSSRERKSRASSRQKAKGSGGAGSGRETRDQGLAGTVNEELRLAAAAAAALSTEGVHSMGAGRYVEAATYGAGEKVLGVVIRPGEVEVDIVADYPLPQEADSLAGLAERIRERVGPQARERTVASWWTTCSKGRTMRVFNRLIVVLLLAGLVALGVYMTLYGFGLFGHRVASLSRGWESFKSALRGIVGGVENGAPAIVAILIVVAVVGLVLLVLELKPRRPRRVRLGKGTYLRRGVVEGE